MNTPSTSNLITQTRDLLHSVRASLIKVAQNLYEIRKEISSENWGHFLEGQFGISESFASKLLTVNRVYLLEGGLSPEKLEGIDYERLYLARNLDMPVELKVENARTLTRSEIKKNVNDGEKKPHEPVWVTYCDVCHLSKDNHD